MIGGQIATFCFHKSSSFKMNHIDKLVSNDLSPQLPPCNMDEGTIAIRLRIQQLVNDLIAVDTDFRIRGLRDPSHVAFMAQFLSTFRDFPLVEQERLIHARIQLLRQMLDVESAPAAQAMRLAWTNPKILAFADTESVPLTISIIGSTALPRGPAVSSVRSPCTQIVFLG